jgi:hypothetical protein
MYLQEIGWDDVDQVYRTQISDQKQAVVKMPIKFQVPDNVEKSLAS